MMLTITILQDVIKKKLQLSGQKDKQIMEHFFAAKFGYLNSLKNNRFCK